jgi:hypothetical protein
MNVSKPELIQADTKSQRVKIYKTEKGDFANWIYCCKEKCDESRNGKCTAGHKEPEEFPEDGKCLYPFMDIFNPERLDENVYETEEME